MSIIILVLYYIIITLVSILVLYDDYDYISINIVSLVLYIHGHS